MNVVGNRKVHRTPTLGLAEGCQGTGAEYRQDSAVASSGATMTRTVAR